MRIPRLLAAAIVLVVAFCILYLLTHSSAFAAFAKSIGAENTIANWRLGLIGLISAAITALTDGIKQWMREPPPGPPKVAGFTERKGVDAPNTPEGDSGDWKQKFDSIRMEYKKLHQQAGSAISQRDRDIRILDEALKEAENTTERLKERVRRGLERRAMLRFSLYCGLGMAFASCVATILENPSLTHNHARHLTALAIAYAGVAALFSFWALVRRGRPEAPIPYLLIGFAALYVDTCAVLISSVYSLDQLFGPQAVGYHHVPLGVWVALDRLLILPVVAVVGSWLGACFGRGILRERHQAPVRPAVSPV